MRSVNHGSDIENSVRRVYHSSNVGKSGLTQPKWLSEGVKYMSQILENGEVYQTGQGQVGLSGVGK